VSGGWAERQIATTEYYRELLENPTAAAAAFTADFESIRTSLQPLHGRLLDVGGGNGLVRPWLPAVTSYVSVDPDPAWLEPAWQSLAPWHPIVRQPLQFVYAMAEQLPFPDASFDCAAAVFSLNHCRAPQEALQQMVRVVRRGGIVLLVLEDVEPGWRDALSGRYRDWRGWSRSRVAAEKLRARWRGWPLEPDHVAIKERDLRRWLGRRGAITARTWHGSYRAVEIRVV
jgi:SAM-dependent methyltransferase